MLFTAVTLVWYVFNVLTMLFYVRFYRKHSAADVAVGGDVTDDEDDDFYDYELLFQRRLDQHSSGSIYTSSEFRTLTSVFSMSCCT